MARFNLLKNGEETREAHKDPLLRTRYYKVSKDKLAEKVEFALRNHLKGWKVIHVNRDRTEFTIEKRGAVGVSDIVVTLFPISPIRCAVDVSASRRGMLGDFGESFRNIMEFFRALNRDIQPEDGPR